MVVLSSSARLALFGQAPISITGRTQKRQRSQPPSACSESAVDSSCRILASPSPSSSQLCLLSSSSPAIRVVARRQLSSSSSDDSSDAVALISGGGSGHEPAHAGFVGQGGLAAAVCGDLFASPSAAAVLAAILHCHERNNGAGVLLVIKNYTGDRLQFGLAAEQARALGVPVEMVIVADDVALGRGPDARGLAGTVLVYKIASAYAETGASLEKVKRAAESVASRVFTLGVAYRGCSLATGGSGSTSAADACDRIPADTMEVGLGIHGEPGAEQVSRKDLQGTSGELVRTLESFVGTDKKHLALLVNNLGGMTPLEMAAITAQVVGQMPSASYITGTLMTSLDMRGFSITVLTSSSLTEDEEGTQQSDLPDLLQLLAAPTDSLAWPGLVVDPEPIREEISEQVQAQFTHDLSLSSMAKFSDQIAMVDPKSIDAIEAACKRLIDSQGLLNDYDSVAGDGDCGSTLSLGAKAVLENLKQCREREVTQGNISLEILLSLMGRSIRQAMGGSSGALLDIFFTAAAATLATKAPPGEDKELPSLTAALKDGLGAMMRYGGAAEGQRTMLDALVPAVEAAENTTGATVAAVAAAAAAAAARGADATKTLAAGAGRARYVPVASYTGQPDPGAAAVAIVLEAFAAGVE